MPRNDEPVGRSTRHGAVEVSRSVVPSSSASAASGEFTKPGSGEYRSTIAGPPSTSRVPPVSTPSGEHQIPGAGEVGLGLSWHFVRDACRVPTSVSLRAVLECLHVLEQIHNRTGDGAGPHGAVWDGNLMFRPNGEAFLVVDPECQLPQPLQFIATEVRQRGGSARRRTVEADVYSAGVMLLEALRDARLSSDELSGLSRGESTLLAEWGADPLFVVALRAVDPQPEARWTSAAEFCWAVKRAGRGRIAPFEALGELVRLTLSYQSDRATPLLGETSLLGGASSDRVPSPEHPVSTRGARLALDEPAPPSSHRVAPRRVEVAARPVQAFAALLEDNEEATTPAGAHIEAQLAALLAMQAQSDVDEAEGPASGRLQPDDYRSGIAPRRVSLEPVVPGPASALDGCSDVEVEVETDEPTVVVEVRPNAEPRRRKALFTRRRAFLLLLVLVSVASLGAYVLARRSGMPSDLHGMREWLVALAWSRWY